MRHDWNPDLSLQLAARDACSMSRIDDSCLNSHRYEHAGYLKIGGIEMGITSNTRGSCGPAVTRAIGRTFPPVGFLGSLRGVVTRAAEAACFQTIHNGCWGLQ
jgi:hypothetical protein